VCRAENGKSVTLAEICGRLIDLKGQDREHEGVRADHLSAWTLLHVRSV